MKVEIVDYDHLGRGIAKIAEKIVFVKKAKVGDVVDIKVTRVKKRYLEAEIVNPKKIDYCPYYNVCGACQIGHLTYDEQLKFKVNLVKNIFSKYTSYNLSNLEIIKTKLYNYRNKVTFHIEGDRLGYYEEASHKLIDIGKCKLLDEDILILSSYLRSFIKINKGLTKAVIKEFGNKLMLVLYGNVDKDIVRDFFSLHVSSLYYNNELLVGTDKLEIMVLGKKFRVRMDSFFQVNNKGVGLIYSEVISLVKKIKPNTIYDLYCGTGTISLLVSDYAKKVVGIEIVKSALLDAKENATVNNINNVKFLNGDVSKIIKKVNNNIDTIIVDPPRSGLDKTTKEQLLILKPDHIIYVSCNPMTLSRDINFLDAFYKLDYIKLVDEFPNTYHVECVCLLKLR